LLLFFAIGYLFGHRNLILYQNYKPKIVNTELGKPKNIDFSLYWEVWNKIHEKYPDTVDDQTLFYDSIQGLVAGTGDPYSEFLEPSVAIDFLNDLQGYFEGVGLELAIKNNQITVVAPLSGTPADKAGIKAGDVIVEIDGQSTSEMTLSQAVQKIRGKDGTKVTLTILPKGVKETKDITMTREKIKIESVNLTFQDNIAILKISQFSDDTSSLMKQKAAEIKKQNVKGIILDLRNDPGGYLETSVDVASFFIKDGPIVFEQYKDGTKDTLNSNGNDSLDNIPLVVLINNGSASASEIVAGAIQDYQKGKIVGEQSFGKGSVQEVEKLKGGSSLRLTIAKWLTPKGRSISELGITPDIEIKLTQDDINNDRDPQLQKAIEEIMKGK